MPRVQYPIRAPFGGLQVNSAQRAVDPHDCIDCLNLHSTFGSLNKRPGLQFVSSTSVGGASGSHGAMLKSFRHGSNAYLLSRTNTASSATRVVDANGNVQYNIATGSEDTIGFATHDDRVYIAGGSLLRTLYTVAGNFTDVQTGIVAPTAAPTVTDTGGGGSIADGTYSYRVTYYNSNLAVESGPSPEGTVTAAGGNSTIRVSAVAGNGDTQITHYRIYRRLNGTDVTWFFMAQQTIATLYDDTAATPPSSTQADALNLIADRPPASSTVCWHNRRMWWGVGTATPRDIRPSEVDLPHKVNSLGGFRIVDNQGDYLIEPVSHNGMLFCFNLNSLWVITGSSLATYRAEKLAEIGCAGRYTITKIGGFLYWMGRGGDGGLGVYRTAGGPPEYLSGDIEDLMRSFFDEGATFTSASAGYEPLSGCYILGGQNSGTGSYARSLAYSIRRRKWFEWDQGCSGFALWSEIVFQRPRLYTVKVGGFDSGALHFFADRETDLGSTGTRPITYRWTTGNMDFGTTREKRFFYASPSFDASGNDPLALDAAINHGALENLGNVSTNGGRQRRPFKIARMGNTLQLRIGGITNSRVSIAGMDVDVEAVGQR